jgi:hypothetical protein
MAITPIQNVWFDDAGTLAIARLSTVANRLEIWGLPCLRSRGDCMMRRKI